MGVEIERRFLVDGRNDKPWRCGKSSAIFQTYLEDKEIGGKPARNSICLFEILSLPHSS